MQHETRLNKVSAEILRRIVREVLSCLDIDSNATLFHKDIYNSRASRTRDLTPDTTDQWDLTAVRRCKQTKSNKWKRQELDNLVEMKLVRKKRRRVRSL